MVFWRSRSVGVLPSCVAGRLDEAREVLQKLRDESLDHGSRPRPCGPCTKHCQDSLCLYIYIDMHSIYIYIIHIYRDFKIQDPHMEAASPPIESLDRTGGGLRDSWWVGAKSLAVVQ